MLMIGLWLCWFIDILWFGVCGSLKCFYFSLVQQYPAWLSVIPVIHDTIVPVFMVESSIRRDTRKCILWFLLNTHNCESQQSHVYQSCHKWQNADSICDWKIIPDACANCRNVQDFHAVTDQSLKTIEEILVALRSVFTTTRLNFAHIKFVTASKSSWNISGVGSTQDITSQQVMSSYALILLSSSCLLVPVVCWFITFKHVGYRATCEQKFCV